MNEICKGMIWMRRSKIISGNNESIETARMITGGEPMKVAVSTFEVNERAM